MEDINRRIALLPVDDAVKAHAQAVYALIAQAEAHAHGVPVEQIHFHEVGELDAIADIVACSMLMEELRPKQVVVSPIHVGSGQVRCAHGILPVPAPATAYILRGIPFYGGAIRGELCTPTGAALAAHFATDFGPMPVMTVEKIGYGMGKKDFPAANCVRAFWGETGGLADEIVELTCNLDDMTAEAMGFAMEILRERGALDVFATSIQMKKSRPATMLTCLCRPEDHDRMARLMLEYTTTIGVRSSRCTRHIMRTGRRRVTTPYGDLDVKTATGYGL